MKIKGHKAYLSPGSAIVLALLLCLAPGALQAADRTWDGGGANALASNRTNWVGDVAPVEGDAIILDVTSHSNMTWNMTNMTVASWTQIGYTGTVTIATVYGPSGFTNLNIIGNCIISNGVWTQTVNPVPAVEGARLRATISGSLTIGPDGKIDVTGKGAYAGPGAGLGSSHGGQGSYNGVPHACYGSIIAPTNLGSRGDSDSGGGAIWITVAGEIRNDGLVCADGFGTYRAGAGGSIWLICGTMRGNGTIQANGGVVNAGGGGRIALVVTNAGEAFTFYTGAVRCLGGGGAASCGTIYLRTADQGPNAGTLIIDNENGSYNPYTQINSYVTDTEVGDVIIRNKGRLLIDTNQTLKVNGIWSNGATFVARTGSGVILGGAAGSTSTLYGGTSFMNLVCTNGDKTLVFPNGLTNTIMAGGGLTLRGVETATNLYLQSSMPGQAWKLNVSSAASQSVWYVDVQDSDARPAAEVLAMFSKDRGHNTNWIFSYAGPGGTNVWTGAVSTNWSVNGNWSLNRYPFDGENIRIPGGTPHYLSVDGQDRVVGGLAIETNALLLLNGYDLTVQGKAVVSGAITAVSTETITLQGDVDFTGGTVSAALSTLSLAGSGAQSINLANLAFYKVRAMPNTIIAFKNGFSAFRFYCEPSTGQTCSLTFTPGTTMTVSLLTLLSPPGKTNIVLQSAQNGQAWGLNVLNNYSVRGVDVQDSDAGAGQTIYASGSHDGGRNLNWNFGGPWIEWTGQTGNGKFEDAANWQPAVVPGLDSWARVDVAQPMTVTSTVTMGRLAVGGSSTAVVVTVNGAVTVGENVTVFDKGALAWNRPGVVSNNVYVLGGGMLTHSGNTSTEANKLQLNVGGDIDVDSGGAIDVTSKGYGPYGVGPGQCGSYGGRGSWGGQGGPCYGSIVAPTNLGSAGDSGSGGGAIIVTALGAILNDGLICADGTGGRAGSGGSIFLTSGTLAGVGAIRANGGSANPAGGGRVSLTVTAPGADFSSFSGTVTASGGGANTGAGTIYKQSSFDMPGRGTVLVANNFVGYTDLPPGPPNVTNEVNFVSFLVTNSAKLRLTNDFIIGDIHMQSASSWLDLGFKTLTVRSRAHPIGPGTATNAINYGAIIWWPDIPKGVVYSTW